MSKKMQSILGKVGLVVLAGAVIGVGAYYSNKNGPQRENSSPTEPASLQQESGEQGKTLYVSPDGNDTNPGTQESPKRTVGAAVDDAGTGDKVVTKPKSPASTSGG
ncbi:MAG: hypothetical protein A2Z25_22255 [Planctomycetes bacterium RBG_16_55_9]|nr:MAG: hypothetical protein A2Z25_22255 [Planctomycetes bacterium RBG_16_55_9]